MGRPALQPEHLALLFELSRAFSAILEMDELLPQIMTRTKEVLHADSCALLLLDDRTQEELHVADHGRELVAP